MSNSKGIDAKVKAAQEAAARSGSSTGEVMVKANGVDICVEAFGNPADPTLLMVQGACASMIRWDTDFCRELVNGGLYVIRFDNRDVGRSTSFTPGDPPYTLEDLADDAIGVLDAFGVERTHILGASSGGMICQLIALRHPATVRTMTLCISTPGIPEAARAVKPGELSQSESDLPSPSAALLDKVRLLANIDWSNEAAAVEGFVMEARAMAGSKFLVDEAEVRRWGPLEYKRQNNIFSFRYNTPIAETHTPTWRHRLKEIKVPTLVIHGTDDPVLPYPHGVALSQEIPGAKLVTLEGVGHELPRGCWSQMLPAIVEHTGGS
jgi:pimeloyl-ACP methyl ester carboxylesterase